MTMAIDQIKMVIDFATSDKLPTPSYQSLMVQIKTARAFSLVNKEFHRICLKKLADLKDKYFSVKYPKYQSDYEWLLLLPGNNEEKPYLYDALLTGYQSDYSTFNKYTKEVASDIQEIVKMYPESLHCNFGKLGKRTGVTPLAAACYNKKIPLPIIELLFKSKANPYVTIESKNATILLIKDLKKSISKRRYKEIKKLFFKYGYKEG